MAVGAYVNSAALNTVTGDQTEPSASHPSFTPTGIIVAANHLTADGGAADARQMMGVGVRSPALSRRYQAMQCEDGSASPDTGSVALADDLMTGITDNEQLDYLGELSSFNSSPNTVTWNLSNAPAAADILNYILVGGDVTIEPFVFSLGAAGTDVTRSLSTLAGRPDAVMFFSHVAVTGDTVILGGSNVTSTLGVMCADGTQWVAGTRHTNAGAASATARWQRTDRCIDMRTSAGTNLTQAAFLSMNADGFSVTATIGTANIRVYGWAFYGGRYTAGAMTTGTGTGAETAVTTTGIAPALLWLQTWGNAADTGTLAHGRRGWGVSDGTRRWALATDDQDGVTPTVADSYLSRSHSLISITAGTPTLDDAWSDTLQAEGFQLTRDTSSGVAVQILYFVMGNAIAGGIRAPWIE